MHLFYDSTLNTWRLITEKLPEKPIDVQHIDFTHPTEGLKHVHIGGDPLAYENRLKKYNKAIATLKQNALAVGNPELIHTYDYENDCYTNKDRIYEWPGGYEAKETMSEGWVPSYNDPDNSGLQPSAEPITIAILTLPEKIKTCRACEISSNDEQVKQMPMHTCGKDGPIEEDRPKALPEEKKNTMENNYERELEIYLTEGINYGANTIKNADPEDLKQLASDSFHRGWTSSGSVRQQLKERDEIIKEFIGLVKASLDSRSIKSIVSRAKALSDKQ